MGEFYVHDDTQNFTVVNNHILRNKNASLKAKGLLAWMLSNKEDWDYTLAGMKACLKENETAITSALNELQELGYLRRTKLLPESYKTESGEKIVIRSHIEFKYEISPIPIYLENQPLENQPLENLVVENQAVENQLQRNTNIINTNINKKAPAEPDALSSLKQHRHKQMRKERATLSDDLESGKNIDEQEKEIKKKSKKKSEEDKARMRINKTEFDPKVKDLLLEFFLQSYNSNSDRRMKSAKDLEGKFTQLRNLIDAGYDAEKVVQQSIDQKWNALYYLQNHSNVDKSNNINVVTNISDTKATKEQLKYLLENDDNPDMNF